MVGRKTHGKFKIPNFRKPRKDSEKIEKVNLDFILKKRMKKYFVIVLFSFKQGQILASLTLDHVVWGSMF